MPKDNRKEIFIVVDEKDTIIDYKTRHECHSDKNLIHRAVGVILYNKKGEILVQKRSKYKDFYPGYYTISASGHVSKGENYIDAAGRELQEELGVFAELRKIKKFLLKMSEETEMEILFTANHDGPFILDRNEVEDVMFIYPEKIKDIQNTLTPLAKECLKILKILS